MPSLALSSSQASCRNSHLPSCLSRDIPLRICQVQPLLLSRRSLVRQFDESCLHQQKAPLRLSMCGLSNRRPSMVRLKRKTDVVVTHRLSQSVVHQRHDLPRNWTILRKRRKSFDPRQTRHGLGHLIRTLSAGVRHETNLGQSLLSMCIIHQLRGAHSLRVWYSTRRPKKTAPSLRLLRHHHPKSPVPMLKGMERPPFRPSRQARPLHGAMQVFDRGWTTRTTISAISSSSCTTSPMCSRLVLIIPSLGVSSKRKADGLRRCRDDWTRCWQPGSGARWNAGRLNRILQTSETSLV